MDRDLKPYVLKRGTDTGGHPGLSINYEQALNSQQHAAATAADGPALIIAGAGSGKTRTLVYRLAYLIDRGVDPASILLLTFTRKAAEEMVTRASVLIGVRAEHVTGGTFHSVANALLRRYGRPIGLDPGFTIMDRSDSEDLINLLRGELGLSEKDKRFPRKATIAEVFSKAENTLATLEDVVLKEFVQFGDHLDALSQLRQAYAKVKRERQLLDYDDLLVKLRELLSQDEATRLAISRRYRYVLVDEYQDTNRLQADVIKHLAATHDNVMVVGDDSQSIYAFRGATFRNIMEFPEMFPGTSIYKLEENYRSTQPILNLANEINLAAAERYSKRLFTRKLEGPLPALVQAASENTQSRFVAQRILELREEGISLNEIAVLFRSSFHSFDLEVELSRRNIPFVKRGGFKFIETAHVKDLLAHLRVVGNPMDTVSWNRMLLLVEGVGPKKAQGLMASVMKSADPLAAFCELSEKFPRALKELARLVGNTMRGTDMTPAEMVNEVYGYYLPILQEQYDDYPKRMRDLEHLFSMAERYQRLEDFLADLALEPPDASIVDVVGVDSDTERMVLSTIHSAKGLEWQCVFIIWLVDGRFPSAFAFMTDEELEEERRLFYVAITRAKHHVFLTYPINVYDRTTGAILSRPTRFLDTVPSGLLETWNLVEETGLTEWG